MAGISQSHLREYETLYILTPDIEDEAAVKFINKMKTLVGDKGGKHLQVTNMGRKKLAWERKRHQKGMFVQHRYLGGPTLVQEYERLLGIDESVLLRQTMLLDRRVMPDSRDPGEDVIDPPAQKEREPRRAPNRAGDVENVRAAEGASEPAAAEAQEAAE